MYHPIRTILCIHHHSHLVVTIRYPHKTAFEFYNKVNAYDMAIASSESQIAGSYLNCCKICNSLFYMRTTSNQDLLATSNTSSATVTVRIIFICNVYS